MSELPPEVTALLGRLSPKQQESFLVILQSARDQESFDRALTQQPELLVALREAVASNLSGIPTDLRAIIDELSQPARSLGEMPRRIELCRQALAAVAKEKRSTLWGWLHSLLGDSLAQNLMGSRADNLEQAIAHYGQAFEVRTRHAYPKSWAATQNNLANAYSQRIRGERAENLEQAIAHYGQALAVRTQQADPEDWAATQNNLAAAYDDRIRGERADNLEQAIAHYHLALEVYAQRSHPERWAVTKNRLAHAYDDRIRGDRAENLEQVIAHFGQALNVYTRQAYPEQWATIQHDLAAVTCKRRRGARAENLEQAIAHCRQALDVFTRQAYPKEWALTQNNLANAYSDRIRGERADNLEQAIAHCRQALEVFTRQAYPKEWALTQNNLANAYNDRIRGERADNLERAITHYRQALELITRQAYPQEWAMAQHNLANACQKRIRGERADNLEQAIAHYQQALEVYTRQGYTKEWGMTQNHLANAYQNRIRGERAENLEQAISHVEQALEVYARWAYPEEWAATRNNMANAYCIRIRGERAENVEQAIAHYEQVLEVYTRKAYPERWAKTQNNLAGAYSNRINGERGINVEQAIACSRLALDVYTPQSYPEDWAMTQNNLANAYRNRIGGDRADNLEQAIAHYQQALDVYTRQGYTEKWASTQNNLAAAYRDRIRGERAENLEQAIAHYRQALSVKTLDRFPADFQLTQRNLAHLYFGKSDWPEALESYREAIRAEQHLLAGAYTETGRTSETAQTSRLYAPAAYALLKLDQPGEALVQLEQGKTRLLSRALALDEVDLSVLPPADQETLRSARERIRALEAEMRLPSDTPARRDDRVLAEALAKARTRLNETILRIRRSHSDFMPEGLTVAEILALIPKHAVLVAPVVTEQGSAVFVVPSGLASVSLGQVLWIDNFKDTDLQTMLRGPAQEEEWGGWLGAYFGARTNREAWTACIDSTGQALWKGLIGAIAERLEDLDARQVLLMPQGGLGLLPLHAAWRKVDGVRRYFLDDYSVTWLPSAYARRVSQDRLQHTARQARTLLAVVNPTEDLPFTPLEGEQVAHLFGDTGTVLLTGREATIKAVKEAMKGEAASHLHFSCHGFYNWTDPMQSGLLLADEKPLTLAQIIGQFKLDGSRLVTLSACETGITDIVQSPDEYLGLPAGFLQAGTPAVVSSLWAVNDLSTMLLMERFYQLHLRGGQDLPNALRQAQIWLREVTAGELAKRFAAEEDEALNTLARMPIEAASESFGRFAAQDPAHCPFAHPFHWAAFTFSGS